MQNISISGTNNNIDGIDPNCKVDKINISGIENTINLNQNCSNVIKHISGIRNKISYNGVEDNSNYNNLNINSNSNVNHRVIHINNFNNGQHNERVIDNIDSINSIINDFNNFGININVNPNQNQNQNVNNMDINQSSNLNFGGNPENLSDFDKKKQDLFLEMDEYQYKHILKYESRKETSCAICLEDFKGIDIIKAFYKCEHIFHKNCLKNWLKRSNVCPLCKHDLTEDINQMH